MMRKETAFRFIPELVGDFARTMELSNNPQALYVEAAINTLHMAANIIELIEEHKNTKLKVETKDVLQKKYEEMEKTRTDHLVNETIRKIDVDYEQLKNKINKKQFREKEVRCFINCLENELHKEIEIFNKVQMDPDYSTLDMVSELTRRILRDYKNLLNIYMKEE